MKVNILLKKIKKFILEPLSTLCRQSKTIRVGISNLLEQKKVSQFVCFSALGIADILSRFRFLQTYHLFSHIFSKQLKENFFLASLHDVLKKRGIKSIEYSHVTAWKKNFTEQINSICCTKYIYV